MINFTALKRSLYPMSIFGIIGILLAAFGFRYGVDFNELFIPGTITVIYMYIPCQYLSYKRAEESVLDEKDRGLEMFLRYDNAV